MDDDHVERLAELMMVAKEIADEVDDPELNLLMRQSLFQVGRLLARRMHPQAQPPH